METLLPSEIARLVLGYLYEQKCDEAAKVFLDTSPHLQECRTVIANGRRFSTKVCGMTLLDVLEKFSAVNSMIQERLSRISDCEQLKHCGDLLEQLKYIVEEPRGQRFVVNINVPTQANSQVSNSSPILSSSLRKRRYSNNDRERNKRHKTPCSIPEQSDPHSNQAIAPDTVEATRLETLPGHVNLQKDIGHINTCDTRNSTALLEPHTSLHSDQGTSVDINVNIETDAKSNSKNGCNNKNTVNGSTDIASSSKSQEPPKETASLEKCTTSTSTEELLSFSCAEVQTTPYDTPESESETNDEPIENLSLLTKELLNRTELQERIAENINKAILPVDVSSKDDVLNSSGNCETNTSIMTEINYAIKSIVEATESDPVFENFLSEIIGPHNEAETSPDEESAVQTIAKKIHTEKADAARKSIESLEYTSDNAEPCNKVEVREVPFRDPPRQENIPATVALDEHCEPEQDQRALEDQNAAAIMSIINANIINSTTVPPIPETAFPESTENRKSSINSDLILRETLANNNNINPVSKKVQPAVKRIRPIRIKRDAQLAASEFISEQDILTMPTLIVCSKNEIDNMISTTTKSQANVICADTTEGPRFLPIASKAESKPGEQECIYLRTVHVPQKSAIPPIPGETSLVAPKQRRSAGDSRPANVQLQTAVATITAVTAPTFSLPLPTSLPGPVPIPVPVPVPMTLTMPLPMSSVPLPLSIPVTTQPVCKVDSTMENINRVSGIEGITLYGKENSVKTTLNNTDVPMINVEETISLSGTGLSPYLKFSSSKTNTNYSLSEIELTSVPEQPKSATLPKSDTTNAPDLSTKSEPSSKTDVITKHTPRTLLKSRSKNHRLSLSTPRRSSHVRALDFNTPAKSVPNRSASENEADGVSPKSVKYVKSVCRTSLFKSPPGVNNMVAGNQAKSPKLCTRKVPIATRSPRPKLMGGWEKYNGVGVIIGDISPQGGDENVDTVLEPEADNKPELKHKISKGNWDEDLRKVLQVTGEQQGNTAKVTNKNKKGPGKESKVRIPSARKTKKVSTLNANVQSAEQQIQGNKIAPKIHKEPSVSAGDSESKIMPEINQGLPKKKALVISQTKGHNSISKSEQKSAKKYVQLKTIKTNLKDKKDNEDSQNAEDKGIKAQVHPVKQSSEFQKMAIEITPQMLPLSEIADLDTPRKFHNSCGVPPTPRLLSPNSNTITPFVKISDDSSKMRSIISTPEFPNTPGVTFTPKHIQESTQDDEKKDEFPSCSPYYKPSCKQDENAEKAKAKAANLQSSSKTLSTGAVETTSHQIYTSARLEITQFEVIKENLPREEAVKELKISTTSREASANLVPMHSVQNDASQHTMKNILPDVNDCNSANKDGKCVDANTDAVENVCKGNDEKEDDDDTSSNSDTSDSESSTSSSSSGSSTTNVSSYSEEYAAFNKNRRLGGKLCTDISNNSNQRCLRVTRSTVNEAAKNAQLEALKIKLKPSTNNDYAGSKEEKSMDEIKAQHPDESSPTKVFSITKTDEQLNADIKETPAKDETLLNEADISETPSSSKNGVENLTNLSSKISALIGSEPSREGAKASASTSADQSTGEKLKQKPRVLSVQHVKPKIATIPVACAVNKEQTNVETGKLIVQLEEKRQRMIAKFREGTQTNVTRGRGNRRRTAFRGRRTGLNGLRRTCHPVATTSQYHCAQYINSNVIVEKNVGSNNNNTIAALVEEGKKTISSENSYLNSMCVSDNLEYDNVSSADEDVEKQPEETQEVMEESKMQENHIKTDVESKPSSIAGHSHNSVRAGIIPDLHSQKCQNTHSAQTVNESVAQKNVSSESIKHTSAENLSRIDQSSCLFKSKVDQIKRDLFSDEENEHKGSSMTKSRAVNDKSDSHTSASNSKPKELSHVLESLELVPASKNDEINDMEEDQDDNECIDTSVSNLFEYHFVYDENVPTKKRRRRYSNRDLEFHANIILTQEDNKECFKLMTPTDLEEIFNISPKMKRRLPIKKPDKNVKPPIKDDCSITACTTICTSKMLEAKPLATSSPVEKPIAHKIKKMPPKTPIANEKPKDAKADARKRIKSEKSQEIEKDNQDKKGRKRKLSESKDSSQTEKKQNTTNPHLLLKKVDLNMFLTQVHGPE